MKSVSLIFLICLMAMPAFAGKEGGGGDTVTCGNNQGEAAELFVFKHTRLGKNASNEIREIEQGIPEWTLTAILTLLHDMRLTQIRSALIFKAVDKFADSDLVETGYKPSFAQRHFNGCRRVYTAHQDFESGLVKVLAGGPTYDYKRNWPANIIMPTPSIPSGYLWGSPLSRAVVQLHEVVLHRNWQDNRTQTIESLEKKTRDDVLAFLKTPHFFKSVLTIYNQVWANQRNICVGALTGVREQVKCVVKKWSGANDVLSHTPIDEVWTNARRTVDRPTHDDVAKLVKMLNENFGTEALLAYDIYLTESDVSVDWLVKAIR